MSALSIQVPFPVFQDRDGQPLDNGYVWIGVANLQPQTNPLVAYFDEALTIIAAQPLRTINGYISNAGTPAQIYVDGVNYSILVQDSKGSMVYNFPDGTGIDPTLDSCSVTYDPTFTGGVSYPVCQKLAQTVSVKDFGAVGDGVTDDAAAIQIAFNYLATQTNCSLYFPQGKYLLNSQVVQSVPNVSEYSIFGDGPSSVILGNNSNGAIKITCSGRQTQIQIYNLFFSPVLDSSGTAFEYSVPEGGTAGKRVLVMQNITCATVQNLLTPTASWDNTIIATGLNRPGFFNVVCFNNTETKANAILNINGCYAPLMENCYFNGAATYGVTNVRATFDNEGFFMNRCTVNGADTGVYVNQVGRHPNIEIRDSHVNAFVIGIHVVDSKFIWISQNLLYSSNYTDGTAYTDVYLDNCDTICLVDNVYRAGGILLRRHLETVNQCIGILVREYGLRARSTIAPFYFAAGARDVSVFLPSNVSVQDFTSYPDVLWESALTNTNFTVFTDRSISAIQNSTATSPLYQIQKYQNTPTNGSSLGAFQFTGYTTDKSDQVPYVTLRSNSDSVTDSAQTGSLTVFTYQANVAVNQFSFGDGVAAGLNPRGNGSISAGGATGSLFFGLGTVRGIYGGAGTPEGVVTASAGSLYLNQSGGAGTTLYIKESGAGNTGWVAK